MMRLLHGLAGDRQFLAVILIGGAARIAPFILLGATALVWWLQ